MDPFLELPAFFPGLHDDMVTYLKASLQDRLPDHYFAAGSDRPWVEVTDRFIEPDLQVRRAELGDSRSESPASVAVAEPRTKPIIVTVPHDERREPYLEIFTRDGDRERLVTTIEILSLSNKSPDEHGRELYMRKQREILDGKVHLVEIDLLRGGEHTTAVRRDRLLRKAGPFDYHVSVHRFDNLEDYFIYPILLEEQLPEIAIPLLPGDDDVVVPMQSVFDRCYETGRYRRRVRYAELALNPTFSARRMEWIQNTLHAQGLK
jgi:hypothetical protein